MLVAISENGQPISLVEKWKREILVKRREDESFYCPICKEKVQLRLGYKKRFHFSHLQNSNCLIQLEGESQYHLEGKYQLYHWLKNQGIDVEIEKYLPTIAQRPDLFVRYKGRCIAIEYQCSPIPPSLFKKRSESYEKNNIHVVWILGGKLLKRKSENTFRLSPFQTLSTRKYHAFQLLYYCSIQQLFLKLTPIYPLSAQTIFAPAHFYPLCRTTFSMLFKEEPFNRKECCEQWCAWKKKWRLYMPGHQDPKVHRFLQMLYDKRIVQLPSLAGVPLQSAYLIETPPIIWQSYLYVDMIDGRNLGQGITYSAVCRYFRTHVENGLFAIRDIPLVKKYHYGQPISEYLSFLVSIGILMEHGDGMYEKVQTVPMLERMEDVLAEDRKLVQVALKQE